jgi:hypothetical protein
MRVFGESIPLPALAVALAFVAVAGAAAAGSLVADSVAYFSGTQGLKSWEYGFYDGDLTKYTPSDFELLPVFDGTRWFIQDGPTGFWTSLTATGGHPNGILTAGRQSATHWAVRRWTSDRTALFTISGVLADDNPAVNPPPPQAAYNGVVGHIFVDGTEVHTLSINEGGSTSYSLTLPLSAGSVLDFAIDPKTYSVRPEWTADYTDLTTFTAQIFVPEPTVSMSLLIGGVLLLGGVGRRRRMGCRRAINPSY